MFYYRSNLSEFREYIQCGVVEGRIVKNPLYRDKLFVVILILAVIVLILSLINAIAEAYKIYSWDLFGGVSAWDLAYKHYSSPITIAAGIFAIYALFTSMHLLGVQSQQQVDARRLNEFTIYFKQREEFDRKFRPWLEEWIASAYKQQKLRWDFFFLDYDPEKYLKKEYKNEHTERASKEFALSLYDFCFGRGRRIDLHKNFTELMDTMQGMLEAVGPDPLENAERDLNQSFFDIIVVDGGLGEFQSIYRSEWFSEHEKFFHSLSIFRLFCEVEVFVAVPRDYMLIPVIAKNIQELNHGMAHGSNVTKADHRNSKGYRERRHPSLSSRYIENKHCPRPYDDDGFLFGEYRRGDAEAA